jgi:hypothetical protein
VTLCSSVPREASGTNPAGGSEIPPSLSIACQGEEPPRDCFGHGIDKDRGIATHLWEGASGGGDDRDARGHRLEGGETEALVETGNHDRERRCHQRSHLFRRQVAKSDDVRQAGERVVTSRVRGTS